MPSAGGLGLARDGGPRRHDPRGGALFARRGCRRRHAQHRLPHRPGHARCLRPLPRHRSRAAELQPRQRQPRLARPRPHRRAALRSADPGVLRQQRGECPAGRPFPLLRRPAPRGAGVGRAAPDRLLRRRRARRAALAVAGPAVSQAPGLVLGHALRLRGLRRRAAAARRRSRGLRRHLRAERRRARRGSVAADGDPGGRRRSRHRADRSISAPARSSRCGRWRRSSPWPAAAARR